VTILDEPLTTLDRFTQRARSLYALPPVAAEVIELTAGDEVDIDCLARCIERDPALTAKVLGVVNSSLFGLSCTVSRLDQAFTLLGTRAIKLLVLGFALPAQIGSNTETELLTTYWRHALWKAVAARELSETAWGQPGDDAFVAGLLQDLGMLALLKELGEPYAAFVRKVRDEGGNLAALELTTLDFDHTILSARLLDHWGLPPWLVRAIAYPPDCERLLQLPEDEAAVPQILHLAELIAELIAEGRQEVLPVLLEVGSRYCALTEEQLHEVVAGVEAKVEHVAACLEIDVLREDYHQLLAQAHDRLADAASEAVQELSATDVGAHQLWRETESLSRGVAEFAYPAATHAPTPISLDDLKTNTGPCDFAGHAGPGFPTTHAEPTPRTRFGHTHVAPTEANAAAANSVVVAPTGTEDPALLGRLGASVTTCRRRRTALTLLMVEIDRFEDRGPGQGLGRCGHGVLWRRTNLCTNWRWPAGFDPGRLRSAAKRIGRTPARRPGPRVVAERRGHGGQWYDSERRCRHGDRSGQELPPRRSGGSRPAMPSRSEIVRRRRREEYRYLLTAVPPTVYRPSEAGTDFFVLFRVAKA
jgi:HD-like signal output (HDOD) protein